MNYVGLREVFLRIKIFLIGHGPIFPPFAGRQVIIFGGPVWDVALPNEGKNKVWFG